MKKQYTHTLDEDVMAKIQQKARDENRNFSSMVNHILKESIKLRREK